MRKLSVSMISLALTTLTCSSALAAKEISKEEAKQYEKIGEVSTTKEYTAPSDAVKDISQKADETGGKYFVITSGNEDDKIRGAATVYK
ncbi:YdgH/BhsA/McbA-like domain containing protein [Pantoea sp. App145]|uniref:YdgH/BhsA/McbA-like domain containing protein n=1 Tax=Pantoea sp. App145 TaxID=3071567 RepID=UPI003A8068FB